MFTDYADNSLDSNGLSVLRNHLSSCQDCVRQWQEFQQTVHLLHTLEPVSPPPDLLAGIQARLEERGLFHRLWQMVDRINFSMSVPAALTTFAIAMLGGFLLKNAPLPEQPAETPLSSLHRDSAGQERQRAFKLPRTSPRGESLVAVSRDSNITRNNSSSWPSAGLKALAAHPIPHENTSRPLSPDMRILVDCDRQEGGRPSFYEELLRSNWRLFQPSGDILLIHLPQEDLPVLHALLTHYSFHLAPAAAASRDFARDKKILTAVVRFQ
jgi:hypothetical protein